MSPAPAVIRAAFRRHAGTILLALALAAGALPSLGRAAPLATQAIENPANLCAGPIARQERSTGIPQQLLAAIALAESGRWDPARSASSAWPWTVMAEGTGQFFPTKQAAVAHVEALRARGVRNIDVGCMQINLLHHSRAFRDLDEAFDPEANVAYAASFLKRLFDDSKSWLIAAGNYHSHTPEHHLRYRAKIAELWTDTRRRAAEEKRLEVMTAYQQRRAAYQAQQERSAAARSQSGAVQAREQLVPPSPQTAMPATATRVASYAPRMAPATTAPRPAVPVGQIAPRTAAVPLERR